MKELSTQDKDFIERLLAMNSTAQLKIEGPYVTKRVSLDAIRISLEHFAQEKDIQAMEIKLDVLREFLGNGCDDEALSERIDKLDNLVNFYRTGLWTVKPQKT